MVYNAFISGEMKSWKTAVDEMQKHKTESSDFLPELINYEYGYIAWCLGNDKKKEAKNYLSSMENNLEKLKDTEGATAGYHAYMAAVYGFRIGLSAWRAPFLGPKSMDHANKALEKDSLSFQANVEMGNIWNHMPELFGGSNEKALRYYKQAINIFEKAGDSRPGKKWLYLNIMATAGKLEYKEGNSKDALHFYKKALNIEPKFLWVKDELLPELKRNLN